MTTEEFIKIVEKLGYSHLKSNTTVRIYEKQCNTSEDGCYEEKYRELANVSMQVEGRAELIDVYGNKALLDLIVKYIETPISERGDKRYFQYRLKSIAKHSNQRWLNYNQHSKQFGLGDKKVINERYKAIFEENDPLLNEVNLNMFDTVETDIEGNDL